MPIQPLPHPPATQPAATVPLTVAAAITRVQSWSDLTKSARGGLSSALETVARMAGVPADSLPLSPPSLRQHVLNRPAAAWGIKASSKGNIRSRLNYVLRRLGLIEPAAGTVSDAWTTALHQLKPQPRAGLTGLARYATARGIIPAAVTATTLLDFQDHLTARTLTPWPRKRVGDLRKCWNTACHTIASWPGAKIPLLPDPNSYILPLAAFPASFREALDAFAQRLGCGSLDATDPYQGRARGKPEDRPLLSPWSKARASTVALRKDHLRWAASALVATGVPVTEITGLDSLFTPLERVHEIARFLYRRAGGQPSAGGMHVAEVLRMVARYHLKRRPTERARMLSWIKVWSKDLRLSYRGMTDKNERTIQAVMNPAAERRLIELPDVFMRAAHDRLAGNPLEAAGLALRAVAIEILTTFPFRLANLLCLRFDRHLHRADPRGPVTGILLSPDEVKHDKTITVVLSARLGRFIEAWATRFRGLIADPGCGYLFPGLGTGDRSMTPQGMREAIKAATGEFVGVVMTPHQFRHLAAYRFLEAYPGQYEVLRQLLGHVPGSTTTERAYCGKDNDAAQRRFDAVITARRTSLPRGPAPKGLGGARPGRGGWGR